MLTQYTSYDEIRAALGVAPEEITNDVLSLPQYEMTLQFELDELGVDAAGAPLSPTLNDKFLALIDVDTTPNPTVDETRFVNIMKVFCSYSVAQQLCFSVTIFSPMIVKDAKTELVRIKDPYKDTKAGVTQFYQLMRARVLVAYKKLYPAVVEATPTTGISMLAVPAGSDPVLGT